MGKGYKRVYELPISIGPILGGIELFLYQLAIGISLRWWEGGPALRLYFGPFKFWLSLSFTKIGIIKGEDEAIKKEIEFAKSDLFQVIKEDKEKNQRYCETKLAKIIPCDLARYEFNSKRSCSDEPKEEHCHYLVPNERR